MGANRSKCDVCGRFLHNLRFGVNLHMSMERRSLNGDFEPIYVLPKEYANVLCESCADKLLKILCDFKK